MTVRFAFSALAWPRENRSFYSGDTKLHRLEKSKQFPLQGEIGQQIEAGFGEKETSGVGLSPA